MVLCEGCVEMNDQATRQDLDSAVFSFLDVETTGLSPQTSRVCEVALIAFQNGCRTAQFSSLVNPGFPIPPEVSKIHGITVNRRRGCYQSRSKTKTKPSVAGIQRV